MSRELYDLQILVQMFDKIYYAIIDKFREDDKKFKMYFTFCKKFDIYDNNINEESW